MKTEEQIRDEYAASIVLPPKSAWPKQQMILAPVGLPGSGKTTVLKSLAAALGLVRISSDELRKLLKENGHGWDHIKELLFPVSEEFVARGYSIAVDADASNPTMVNHIEQVSEKHNVLVFWIHMVTPREYVFKKFRNHPPSWLATDLQQMIDNYIQQEERYKERTFEFDYISTFDTSSPDLRADIHNCVDRIKTALAEQST